MIRKAFPLISISAIHLALTIYSLLASLYLIFPGEPGFDPVSSQRADIFAVILDILGFPVLTILTRLPRIPITSGLAGWLWFMLNSLLWASAILVIWKAARPRIMDLLRRE